MKNKYSTILIFLFLTSVQKIFTQQDSAKNKSSLLKNDSITITKIDSINNQIFKDFNKKLESIDNLRRHDSLKKIELEQELNSLKTTDNLKKEELLKQLKDLKEKEKQRISEKKKQIDSLKLTANSFPVLGFFKDTLFNIYSKLGSFSAFERAEVITNRIKKISKEFSFNPDSIRIVEVENTVDLMIDDKIIMSISETDALWNNLSKLELAEQNKAIIGIAIERYRNETSLTTLGKEFALAGVIIFILGILIYYIAKFFSWTSKKIRAQENIRFHGIKINNYTLFDTTSQVTLLVRLNNVIKWIIIILSIYISLPLIFGIFPWTKEIAETLFSYFLNPLVKFGKNLWEFIPNLITIIVIIILFHYVLKGLNFLRHEIEKGHLSLPGFYADWANPTYQITRVVIIAFMVVVIFPYLPGSNSPVFRGVSVFLGFLFTFGSAGSLSNIVAGLVLTYMRLFKIGDRVKIGEVIGDVIEKSLLVTRIRTIKNEIISIPNSTVMSSHTINYTSDSQEKGLILHTTITLGYDIAWKKVHQALIEAAHRTEFVLEKPEPFVLQTSLDDFYVSYQINAYTKESNKQAKIYSDLHQNIQDCCNEVGIEILSPHYRAARDGNMSTIPEDYLPKNYSAPSFNFKVKKEE